MENVQVWVLSGVLGVVVMVFSVLFKNWVSNQEKLVSAINKLEIAITQQSEQLKTLIQSTSEHARELKDLDRRVVKLEQRNLQ